MFSRRMWTVILTVMLVPVIPAAQARGPRLSLEGLERLSGLASESVDVSLDTSLLGLALRFLDADNQEERALKAVAGGLQGIYVRSYQFEKDGAYPTGDVDAIRRQLASPGWSRLVGVKSRKEGSDVDVYLWLEDGHARGLGILSSGPREVTVVNILGAIELDQLRRLEGLGVPKLEIEKKTDKRASPPRED
jgi:hypothetical protein